MQPRPCVNARRKTGKDGTRFAQLVYKRRDMPPTPQGKRCFQHDYCAPWFYMITMTTLGRIPLFGTCENGVVTPSRDGWIMHDLWRDIPKTYPQIETSTFVIMPDHIHGIIHVKASMEKPVGVPLRAFKSLVTSALRKRYNNPDMQVWNPGYHDLCVWRPGSLAAYSNYIRDNPRRLCLKRANPDLFTRVNGLTHSRLPPMES
jgi:REP element-mobilizing transposase RayT